MFLKHVNNKSIEGHGQPEVSHSLNITEVAYVHSNGINNLTRSVALSHQYTALQGRIKYHMVSEYYAYVLLHGVRSLPTKN